MDDSHPDLADALPDAAPVENGAPASAPSRPAVYALLDAEARPILLATAQDFRRAIAARVAESSPKSARRADLAAIVRFVRWRQVHSAFEASWRHYQAARSLYPDDYPERIGFGPACYLGVDWGRGIPEIAATPRIWHGGGEWVGPWPDAQSAQLALEGLWDLFDLCRFPAELRRAPAGTRCAYAEMGRCDAPCDTASVLAAYVARTRAAWSFACGGAGEWAVAARERMRAFADQRRYERASQIKQQLEFAAGWQRDWGGVVRPARDHRYLLAIPVARRRSWTLFAFDRGALASGPTTPARKLPDAARRWLPSGVVDPVTLDSQTRMEQSWLLAKFLHHPAARSAAIVASPDPWSENAISELFQRVRELDSRGREASAPEGHAAAEGAGSAFFDEPGASGAGPS